MLAVVTSLIAGGFAAPTSAAPVSKIQLLASAIGSMKAGDPIAFTLTLVNRTPAPVAVSPGIAGNIRVVSVTRNGTPVRGMQGVVHSDIPLAAVIDRSVTLLNPSARLVLKWNTDSQQAPPTLRTFNAQRDPAMTTDYVLRQPGDYRIRVQYQWGGSANVPRVYRPASNVATVAFTIHP